MSKRIKLPEIPEAERTPLVNMLLKINDQQNIIIGKLEIHIHNLTVEIKRIKKQNQKPKIQPSKMDKGSGPNGSSTPHGDPSTKVKRKGFAKRNKTQALRIDKQEVIKPIDVPSDARFKGYAHFVVQDITISTINTEYKLERWKLSNGKYLIGKLPEHLKGQHFGPKLRAYILHQYYHQCVTQPLLLAQLREFGVDISSGQLNHLLIDNHHSFHKEKDAVLETGLTVSSYVHTDDTGARHQGKNGYCTHIGNPFFTWFKSTCSKSRINFIELLRAAHQDYCIDDDALAYMEKQKLPQKQCAALASNQGAFLDIKAFEARLDALEITTKRHRQIATEGALIGSILSHGFNPKLVILSDDAGQFNILLHALCWIHAERKINALVPGNPLQALAIAGIRRFFWQLYADLKAYKQTPSEALKTLLEQQFDALCDTQTCFELLNQALKRMKKNKEELLLVLERPEIPLHNNPSEGDIREYVKRRKVSGGTRSDIGRESRDTFLSLKKTCKKLGLTFWDYLHDRIQGNNKIQNLSMIIQQAALN